MDKTTSRTTYRLTCLLCGLHGDEVPPATMGAPTHLVALQEHVVHAHFRRLGYQMMPDVLDVHQKGRHERHDVAPGVYEWDLNGVRWLRAEEVMR